MALPEKGPGDAGLTLNTLAMGAGLRHGGLELLCCADLAYGKFILALLEADDSKRGLCQGLELWPACRRPTFAVWIQSA